MIRFSASTTGSAALMFDTSYVANAYLTRQAIADEQGHFIGIVAVCEGMAGVMKSSVMLISSTRPVQASSYCDLPE